MIPDGIVCALGFVLGLTTVAPAVAPDAEPYRMSFEDLVERMVGTAAQPVRFDWRKQHGAVGLFIGDMLELNNFATTELALESRLIVSHMQLHVRIHGVRTTGSASTDALALTPYRQSGRPTRLELAVGLAVPVAEGVITTALSILPALEMVLSACAELRYMIYPGSLRGASWGDGIKAVFAPGLTQQEITNLEPQRQPAMRIDPSRYAVLLGLRTDVYVRPGIYVAPQVLLAIPIWGPITGSALGFWWDLAVGVGYVF